MISLGIVVAFLLVPLANCLAPAGWVPTPVGLVHKDCLHRVPSGTHIADSEDGAVITDGRTGEVRRLSPCGRTPIRPPGQYDGWLAYVTSQADVDYDTFLGIFSVPNAPADDPEVLYLFTALQNVDWIPLVDPNPGPFDIIQPVLQYPGDNGDYWSVKSWYVTLTNDVVASDEIQVSTGDEIFGNMTKTATNTFYIGGTDTQSQQNTYLSITRDLLATQPWAYCTAECYGCGGCSYEPTNAIDFTKLQLFYKGQQLTPKWVPSVSPNPMCNEKATVNDATSVTITFQ
jgi:hypothetical protein